MTLVWCKIASGASHVHQIHQVHSCVGFWVAQLSASLYTAVVSHITRRIFPLNILVRG